MNDTNDPTHERSDRRAVLLHEAIWLFNESGYDDTRLEDIGARLGTSKTSISYHFQSKEGLVQEVYDQALAFSETALQKAESEGTGRSALLAFVRAHIEAHARSLMGQRAPLALLGDLPILPSAVTDFTQPRYKALIHGIYALFLRGRSDGSINVPSAHASCFFILNILHWLPRWLGSVRLPDQEAETLALLDVLERGIAQPGLKPWSRPINRDGGPTLEGIFDAKTRNAMKREALLRVGTRNLNAYGYRRISLSDVASELGVTRGALYYHFADKDALINGCFEHSCELIETTLELADSEDMKALNILMRALRLLSERQFSNLDPLIRLSRLGALGTKDKVMMQARLNRISANFANLMARGMGDGSVRIFEIKALEHILIGTLFAANKQRLALLKPLSDIANEPSDVTPQSYYHILLYGLKGLE
ncbi:MAG: TetR/AcrR family transcriptional regulator [Henriciella sp.]|nr:TetR/AcrR family transcriptional regulator [Henriciella sp.]